MLGTAREIFLNYLYQHYSPIPPRTKAPEIGLEIGVATWSIVAGQKDILRDWWIDTCKRLANEILKDPPDIYDELQEAFGFFKTPEREQILINKIGHRRMQSPDDGAMVDLIDPKETSSDELLRLANKLETYGNQCIERSKYIRQLAKLRKQSGF